MIRITILLLTLVSGCSALGLSPATTFDQQLANAYGVHTAVVSATTLALTSGSISLAEATQVQTQALSARAILDTARSVEQTNPAGASSDLTLALTALTAIQTYLNGRTH